MLEIRDLQYLSALARMKHFAKAAQECGVSQPAFSLRIRGMEDRLGVTIVRRGNRYQGLIAGGLSLGVVPTAAAYAARLAIRLHAAYPGIVARIETATSLAIQQGIDDGTFDAGLTYDDAVSGDMMTLEPLYEEHYVLLAPVLLAPRLRGTATWAEAAELPLSLLEPGMQNRRIVDRVFEEAGARPQVISETNALTTSVVMACEGACATVLPRVLLNALGPLRQTVTLPLVKPVLRKTISLVTASRMPGLPTVEALRRTIGRTRDKKNKSHHIKQ